MNLKFDDKGLIPAVIQDAATGEILMLAYMDQKAVTRTLVEKQTVFYSRSRNAYWVKGESSGHSQKVVEVMTDCDHDTLVIRVKQKGGACHLGYRSCFVHPLNEKGELGSPTQKKVFDPDTIYHK